MSVASVCHTLLGKGVTVVEGKLDGKIAVFAVIVELAKILDNIALTKVALFVERAGDRDLESHIGIDRYHLVILHFEGNKLHLSYHVCLVESVAEASEPVFADDLAPVADLSNEIHFEWIILEYYRVNRSLVGIENQIEFIVPPALKMLVI